MIKVAIVEDNDHYAAALTEFLNEYQREIKEPVEIVRFSNGLNFVEDYEPGYDIVFMDIEMPRMNGIEASKVLRERDEQVAIVFLTVMSQYAVCGYEVGAADFIVKPFKAPVLRAKLNKILRRRMGREDYIIFASAGEKVKVLYREICFVETLQHYCVFHTERGEFRKLITLSEVEKYLAPHGFLRTGNSFLVNLVHVTAWGKIFVTVCGQQIPVSRSRKKEFLDGVTRFFNGGKF